MGKVSEVEISGHRYRYEYVDGQTVYRGPVGDAPELSEAEFLAAMSGQIEQPEVDEILLENYSTWTDLSQEPNPKENGGRWAIFKHEQLGPPYMKMIVTTPPREDEPDTQVVEVTEISDAELVRALNNPRTSVGGYVGIADYPHLGTQIRMLLTDWVDYYGADDQVTHTGINTTEEYDALLRRYGISDQV